VQKTAETLRGILTFARSQCFGRCGALAMHYLSEIACGKRRSVPHHVAEHLRFWPKYFKRAVPRTIVPPADQRPLLLFVDGAEEEKEGEPGSSEVGVGAVLIELDGEMTKEAFGGIVPSEIVGEWRRSSGKKKVIHQAELYPSVLAVEAWQDRLRGRRVLLFFDNDAARISLIKGTTTSRPSAVMVQCFWEVVAANNILIWVDRVPTICNPADGPSRSEWVWCQRNGVTRLSHPGLESQK
jgi:hypothetical protein